MGRARLALRDLFRRPCWTHTGIVGWSGEQWPEYADPPSRKPWVSRFVWRANIRPWFGGDEWCRWTIVLPLGFAGLVVPLWSCRNPDCEACTVECIKQSKASSTVTEDT